MARTSMLAAFAGWCALAGAQAGPNTLAKYNPAQRTQSTNSTYCIVPIDKEDAKTITGHAPLDVPSDILPSFPEGKHPLIVHGGYNLDIRMTALNIAPLQIPALMQGGVSVPYIDATDDGKTAIYTPVNTYIGGTDGHDLQSLVPAIAAGVSPFEGTTSLPTTFAPSNAAVANVPEGLYSLEAKPFLLPNQISGPGVYFEAYDLLYRLTDDSPYTEHTFHALINTPSLLNNGRCQRNTVYFNETFANPKMAVGNVTLYHELLGPLPGDIEGTYTDVYCYQANGVQVGETAQSCEDAAASVDPAALE